MEPILAIRSLTIEYAMRAQTARALDDMALTVAPGEVVGILGESGSGKSVLARSILGLVDEPGRVVSGEILFDGADLVGLSKKEWHRIRGKQIGLIVSNARAQLNALVGIGRQIGNVIQEAEPKLDRDALRERVVDALNRVGIPDATNRLNALPHEFSGGMCQRVVIAMAMANSPRLLVADEPTSGLDVTVQRQVLDLMRALVQEFGGGVLLMTRDPGVVAHFCDRVIVMRRGAVVETGEARQFFRRPSEEYSRSLILKAVAAQAGTGAVIAQAEKS